MDHLSSDSERRARWYSSHWPRYVPVRVAQSADELLQAPERRYEIVHSCPYEWLTDEFDSHHVPTDLLRRALEVHGFVVVSNVLSNEECSEAINAAWNWIEEASAAEHALQENGLIHSPVVKRDNPMTHSSPLFPRSVEGGMLPFYGSGHSEVAWMVRSNPKVKQIFTRLHGTQNVVSSLDGIVLWRSTTRTTDAGWFHVDQNPVQKPGHAAVQGLVNLIDTTISTGGNALVAKSHLAFGRFTENNPEDSCCTFYQQRLEEVGEDNWLEIDPQDERILQPEQIITVLLGAGDVLLWDSRVAHCSYPAASSTPDCAMAGLVRAATLVSMIPSSQVETGVMEARRKAVDGSRTLTHWVDKVAPLGEERSDDVAMEEQCVDFIRRKQKESKKAILLRWDDLTPDQKKLVVGEC